MYGLPKAKPTPYKVEYILVWELYYLPKLSLLTILWEYILVENFKVSQKLNTKLTLGSLSINLKWLTLVFYDYTLRGAF